MSTHNVENHFTEVISIYKIHVERVNRFTVTVQFLF